MTRTLCFLVMFFLAIDGFQRDSGKFPNMDKWILTENVGRRPLHGHPKQVTEYRSVYSDIARPDKSRGGYVRYTFDAEGNLVHGGTYINDTLRMEQEYRYDANGMWEKKPLVFGFG